MNNCACIVKKVLHNSIAKKIGIKKGDEILSLGGYKYVDEMDLTYFDSEEVFDIKVKRNGEELTFHVSKSADEIIGLEMGDDSEIIPCKNNCTFCFVRQLPKGLRSTLYVKDDDYRMSFSMGSYVTLSNLTEEDLDRIIRLSLSPLYISVHCFTPELKLQICKNPQSAKLFDTLKKLKEANITMHTQIVMMEGVNDGEELKLTISELAKLRPQVKTVAVVPVGLTKHREGLPTILPISEKCAKETIAAVETINNEMIEKTGESFCWCSDEMYIKAGCELPSYDYYGDFDQIENGVGLVADFFATANEALSDGITPKGEYSAITGVSFAPILKKYCEELERKYPVKIDVCPVVNDFFGDTVTVAGLVTGGDIIKQYAGKLKKNVILPKTMLKEFCGVFLDDVTLRDLEKTLKVKTHISASGDSFIRILGGER